MVRLWASLLLLATVLSSSTSASPIDFENEEPHSFDERAGGTYPITGPGGPVRARLEIRTMYSQKPYQWTLYLNALRQMQYTSQTNQTSWFQIAGIHGSPNIPWDGVQQSAPGIGYCTHSINLFPPWHRPYIALFEQNVLQHARKIAAKMPANVRQNYMTAATLMRVPYWDWAVAPPAGQPTMPILITAAKVTLMTPTGQQTINNPLYRYQYHPLSDADFSPYAAPFDQWHYTLRYPQDESSDAISHDGLAVTTIENNRVAQKQGLYNWFTLCPDYLEMSNDESSSSNPSCHISLESLHNNIHVWIGGNNDGHMTVIPVSANDPTFMLHHTMIDRLFAMWQAVYPNSYCTDQTSNVNTFTINIGSVQGPTSPLTPFHSDTKGTFWTSDAVRNWEVFSYTYPEFNQGDGGSASIMAAINNLYGPNSAATAAGAKAKRDVIDGPFIEYHEYPEFKPTKTKRNLPGGAAPPVVPTTLTTANNGSSFQYIANIATTRFGLAGSYTVYVFMGQPASESPDTWSIDGALIGSYGVFSSPNMTANSLITTSSVALTEALVQQVAKGNLTALDPSYVVPFLTKNLDWRVATSSGLTVIDPADIPDFVLSVVSSTMQPPATPESFPIWSEFQVLTQITHGKPGGLPLGGVLSYLGARST